MPNKVIPIITEGETDGCIVDAFEEAFYSERLSFTGVASGGDITLYIKFIQRIFEAFLVRELPER